jgi:oligoendopeptidase F
MDAQNLTLVDSLPEWNLADLYPALDSPKIEGDIQWCTQQAIDFQKKYEPLFKTEWCTEKDFFEAISLYERISETMGRLSAFASLLSSKYVDDGHVQQFHQRIQEVLTDISTHFVFFPLAINAIDDAALEAMLTTSKDLQKYAAWLRQTRLFRPHQLSQDLEKVFLEKSITSLRAWNRLYDETLASLRFQVDGETLNISSVTDLMSHVNPAKRRAGALALAEGLKERLPLFTMITNTLSKDKDIEDRWRKYPFPTSERHLWNQVEPEVVDALFSAVKESYPKLSHRYYGLKAKILNQKTIEYWDRNAPLPYMEDTHISWLQAQAIVLNAYEQFSPKMASIGERFFDNGWIDAPVQDGKTSGAFAHPTVPSVHPYILLNYLGKQRDVMTLAHELGHGIHQVLSARQGYLQTDTPLTIAETASVFGEMLTFRSLLAKEASPAARRQLLASKIEDMLNTVVRQIAFYDFEQQVHSARKKRELSSEDLSDLFLTIQREALGPSVHVDEAVGVFWAYISHFIHAPFYVYAYAFGDCLVNSLYAVYESEKDGFEEKYLDMLRAGGSKRYPELLAPFGLDAKSPDFWHKGLAMIENLIDELEHTLTP